MSLEETLAANTAALTRNSDLLERVIAGQEAALEKLASGGSTTTRKPRAKAADAAPETGTTGNAEGADTGSTADDAGSASETTVNVAAIVAGIGTDAEKLKAHITAWTGATEDADERAKRVGLLKAMAEQFGVKPAFAELVPNAQKAIFFVERARALGLDAVDVKAAYDFDGDPTQEAPAAATESDFG